MNILQRINEVRKSINYIQKNKSVSTGAGSYMAVTHDTVTALVRPAMIEHGIVCWPNLVASASLPKDDGAKQFRYEATYNFTFANVEDISDYISIRIQAHAMDNADKAPGKALSYAKKYAMLKLFEIETGESEESRYDVPEGLPESEKSEILKNLTDCKTIDDLAKTYLKAQETAKKAEDGDFLKVIVAQKNIKKTALMKTEPAI